MTYDRRQIMKTAWSATHEAVRVLRYSKSQVRDVFRRNLGLAWDRAKEEAYLASLSVEALRAMVEDMENRDRLGHDGIARLHTLRAALRSAIKRDADAAEAADHEAKRALIASAGGRFCVVTFTKADGSERVMRLQPATLKFHVKGEAASEAARKAVATRAQRHPHLLPVWDADNQAPRSVNLATIRRIAVNGAIHQFNA